MHVYTVHLLSGLQDTAPTRSSGLAEEVREHFPILQQGVNGKPLVYLDSAATSQKPTQVLDVIREFNLRDTANVHRGVHALASRATDAYEAARGKVATLINASSDREIVWTKNATEAINLVAQSWAMHNLNERDEVFDSRTQLHYLVGCPDALIRVKFVLTVVASLRCRSDAFGADCPRMPLKGTLHRS